MEVNAIGLKEQWIKLKEEQPGIRIRNAAKILDCSEVELLVTHTGDGVTRLRSEFPQILSKVQELGYVMALTRNDNVVHERKGIYKNWTHGPHASLFVGEDIDLRIFLNSWSSAFAVREGDGEKSRYSLQFFARDGEAIHKIYLTPKSQFEAYEAIISEFKSDDQSKTESVTTFPNDKGEMPDDKVDRDAFGKDWLALQDTHDFYGLLGKYRISRTQALRLAPSANYAVKVQNDSLRKVFNLAAEREVPIMVFVGNRGMLQIHTGPIKNLMDRDEWFNVLDEEFNLHLRESAISETWVVRKPSRDGIVTSLELYDSNGKLMATIFGKRKPGIAEMEEWKSLISEIENSRP